MEDKLGGIFDNRPLDVLLLRTACDKAGTVNEYVANLVVLENARAHA